MFEMGQKLVVIATHKYYGGRIGYYSGQFGPKLENLILASNPEPNNKGETFTVTIDDVTPLANETQSA